MELPGTFRENRGGEPAGIFVRDIYFFRRGNDDFQHGRVSIFKYGFQMVIILSKSYRGPSEKSIKNIFA